MTDTKDPVEPLMANGSDTAAEKAAETGASSNHKGGGDEQEWEETRCGVFSWRPSWLSCCSNMKAFTAVLSFLSVFGSMNYSYYTAVITQIEKAYGLSSSMTGFIKNVDNIGFMAVVLLVSHFCRYSNMPRLFAGATLLSSVAIFIFALPHFIYGSGHQSTDAWNASISNGTSQKPYYSYDYCVSTDTSRNSSSPQECTSTNIIQNLNTGALALFVISELLQGMAQSPKVALSLTFMDDNAKENSPTYFGFMFGMRAFAPVMGFVLGAWTTTIYVDLSDPGIDPTDPRWVGAWWLGFVICAACSVVWTIPLVLFPPRLADQKNSPKKKDPKLEIGDNFKELPRSLWRLLKNPVLICIIFGAIFNIYMVGFMTFLPKYLEMHFGQTASKASIWTGIIGSVSWGVGPIVSGKIMSSMKVTATNALRFVVAIHIFAVLGFGSMMFISCPEREWAGKLDANSPNLTFGCNADCGCETHAYTPVCGADDVTYYSPCYAGCQGELVDNATAAKSFYGCSCIEGGTATVGMCPANCTTGLIVYLVVMFVVSLVTSMSIVPMMTTIMRCVSSRDKALSIAMTTFLTQIASFPAPLVFGLVIDRACTVLQSSCSRKGACLLYDTKIFRLSLHGMASALKLGGLILYAIAWHKSKTMKFADYDEEIDVGKDTPEKSTLMVNSEKDEKEIKL